MASYFGFFGVSLAFLDTIYNTIWGQGIIVSLAFLDTIYNTIWGQGIIEVILR